MDDFPRRWPQFQEPRFRLVVFLQCRQAVQEGNSTEWNHEKALLAAAAMAALAISLATAQAQQAQERERMPAASRSQQSAPHAADQKRNLCLGARSAKLKSDGPQQQSDATRCARRASAERQGEPWSTEPLRSNQARERSGDRVRRDTRDRTQRNQARDARRDFDQRSRASRERIRLAKPPRPASPASTGRLNRDAPMIRCGPTAAGASALTGVRTWRAVRSCFRTASEPA
jgi:hypothetical protein